MENFQKSSFALLKEKPKKKPTHPYFSSGPCPKAPSWSLSWLENAFLNRSHRSKEGKERLAHAHALTRKLLNCPDSYALFFVPGSGTGAIESVLWSLLGPRGVDVLAFEHFGKLWAEDIIQQLKLKDIRCFYAEYGEVPDLSHLDFERDLVFPWTGTSSSVNIDMTDWKTDNRKGLIIADATAAIFTQKLDFEKFDVLTFSWQKALGSEAGHGTLILSPRALERLRSYTPPWPIPRLFRLKENGQIKKDLFEGSSINTPSMLCIEDYIAALNWAIALGDAEGGYAALVEKTKQNAKILEDFLEKSSWATHLVKNPKYRAKSCVCIKISDEDFNALNPIEKEKFLWQFCQLLEQEKVAFDIASYRHAPKGLRIWTGPTIESQDLKILCLWLDYAFYTCKKKI